MRSAAALLALIGLAVAGCERALPFPAGQDLMAGQDLGPPAEGAPCVPWDLGICPPGQTCWPFRYAAPTMEVCRNNTPGAPGIGGPCEMSTAHPTCARGLLCLAITKGDAFPHGHCVGFCDESAPLETCPPPAVCSHGGWCGPQGF